MVKQIVFLLIFIFSQQFALKAQTEEVISNCTMMVISSGPTFNGDLKKFIQKNVRYPATAIRDSIEGCVVVQFAIDTLGQTQEHHVIKSIREDLDKEALRVARLIKFDVPARQRAKAVPVNYYVIPVDFQLGQDDINTKARIKKQRGKNISL